MIEELDEFAVNATTSQVEYVVSSAEQMADPANWRVLDGELWERVGSVCKESLPTEHHHGQAAEESRFEAAIRAAVSGELIHMIQLTNGDAGRIRRMLDAKLEFFDGHRT
jgi:hypothetical protein